MPTPTPLIPAQRPPTVWETDELFREPRYEGGAPWTGSDDLDDEDA